MLFAWDMNSSSVRNNPLQGAFAKTRTLEVLLELVVFDLSCTNLKNQSWSQYQLTTTGIDSIVCI